MPVKFKLGTTPKKITISGSDVTLQRDLAGVVQIKADSKNQAIAGLGFMHAHDRMLQMAFLRIIVQGRISEKLTSDSKALKIDTFMRQIGFYRYAKKEVSQVSLETLKGVEAYCRGVNEYLDKFGYPFEFKLVGYRPEPWSVEDCLATIKIMSYIGLAQSQQDTEKLIIQSIIQEVDIKKLKSLYFPHLNGLTKDIIGALKKLSFIQPLVPEEIQFLSALPKFIASNNWVVSGKFTQSGFPMECHDPHLEVNRLPAIWYEAVVQCEDNYLMGATVPGVPGVVMGRNRDVSLGFTYGFMDQVDYFVEEVCAGNCKRSDGIFVPLEPVREVIKRKMKSPSVLLLYENEVGTLETNPNSVGDFVEDGFYLNRAWSAQKQGAAASLEALNALFNVKTVDEAREAVSHISISANWLIADRKGDIAYQQSGILPNRNHSGLYPELAWKPGVLWTGFVSGHKLATTKNPDKGFIVTANNDIDNEDFVSVNVSMGAYRKTRIEKLLREKIAEKASLGLKVTLNDMKKIQTDIISNHALENMKLIRPHLPDSREGRALRNWDCKYHKLSKEAVLFEAIYAELLDVVLGKNLFGQAAWDWVGKNSELFVYFHHLADRVLHKPEVDTEWFLKGEKNNLIKASVVKIMKIKNFDNCGVWGDFCTFTMKHIFFDEKLPLKFGFDYGPITMEGGRGTIVQGAVYESHGRKMAFWPSMRWVSDLGSDSADTVLAGGVSDRRFSSLYTTDIKRWLNYEYKTLTPLQKI